MTADRKAVPTLYRGVQYRSRLEAKWAAFFDLLKWPFQYEPFDLGGWIPDFLLTGEIPVLVEVKPVTAFPKFAAEKMLAAHPEDHFDLLILGCVCPTKDQVTPYGPGLGWLKEGARGWGMDWGDAAIVEYDDGRFGFIHDTGYYMDRIYGIHEQDHPKAGGFDGADPDRIKALWNMAGNAVQWRGVRSEAQ